MSQITLQFTKESTTLVKESSKMVIERTKNEIIIKLSSVIDTEELQNLINYLTYREATEKSKARQEDVDKLSKDVKKGWWNKNRRRFIK